ncbi:hypothetical protein EUX98_g2313 [Antrodiella citrinella]|uniref:Uncharacterized protein n=1 Tax=Antrodiella citrinella TaxID=2447956 RepID=A0A4S4N248_9APHY|nr:hypothetical protein EUX98_g2313 [Antrodiella citrinella]
MSSAGAGPSKPAKKKAAATTKKSQKYKSKETIDDDEDDNVQVASEPKYEGTNTGWDYEPPKCSVLANHAIDAEEFDYDALKGNEDLELWIIRIPDATLQLDAPSSASTGRIGTFERRSVQYDVWSLGNDDSDSVGGEELKGLTCLVPRKKKGGNLYAAPSIPTHHLVISVQASLPTPPQSSGAEGSSSEPTVTYTNPPRPSYPVEALKHRFMPIGSLVRISDSDIEDAEVMDVDDIPTEVKEVPEKKEKKKKEKKEAVQASESKPKKRKVEADSSPVKKPKKVKT